MRFDQATLRMLVAMILLLALACGGKDESTAGAGAAPAPGSPPQEAPGNTDQGLLITNNHLVNRGAGYSLEIPEGWLLYDQSTPERVVLQGPGVKVAFAILARPKTGSLEQEAASLETVLGASGMQYEPIEHGKLEIGGHPAQKIAFRGMVRETAVVAENYVVQTSNITFILGYEAEETQRSLLADDVEQIVKSIRFGSPVNAPPA